MLSLRIPSRATAEAGVILVLLHWVCSLLMSWHCHTQRSSETKGSSGMKTRLEVDFASRLSGVVVVEDLISTGGSSLKAVVALREGWF